MRGNKVGKKRGRETCTVLSKAKIANRGRGRGLTPETVTARGRNGGESEWELWWEMPLKWTQEVAEGMSPQKKRNDRKG